MVLKSGPTRTVGQKNHSITPHRLTYFSLELGWLGGGWESDQRNWDPIFLLNVGEPNGECEESPSGVFWRKWSLGTPVLDCNKWSAQLPFGSL